MFDHRRERDLRAIATLNEPARRRLYDYVLSQPEPVSRDQAAEAAGVTRALAAFHLDRLVEVGLLAPEYRRLSGRSGPGAGRPSKLYRRADEVQASAPPRQYEFAAQLFADALVELPQAGAAVQAAARRLGESLAQSIDADDADDLEAALRRAGYEPVIEPEGEIRLLNCPFHALASRHRELTCGMNLALLEGLTSGAGERLEARLAPRPGYCCVALRAR